MCRSGGVSAYELQPCITKQRACAARCRAVRYFCRSSAIVCRMEKREHGKRLASAMARKQVGREALADLVEKKPRTITNWTSGTTMPDDIDREKLRNFFPGYDAEGDPVEVAIRSSDLQDWRQDAVLSFYKRNLHEQRSEQVG
jgi:hypothetical protein